MENPTNYSILTTSFYVLLKEKPRLKENKGPKIIYGKKGLGTTN